MEALQMFAVEPDRLQALPVPAGAVSFTDMVAGFDVGVYSALRTFRHHFFLHLEDHLARTRQSMELLGWQTTLDEARLRQALDAACRAYPGPEARVRYDILPAPAPALQADSSMIISLLPLPEIPPGYYEDGVSVDFAPSLHRAQPLIKRAEFARVRDHLSKQQAAYEMVLTDGEGYILEGSGSNFYGVIDGVLYTAGTGILEGVTRKLILQQAAALGIPIRLQPVHREQVDQLAEAAISSSSRALIPVTTIAGRQVGDGRPGAVSRRLLIAYNDYVAAAVRPAWPHAVAD